MRTTARLIAVLGAVVVGWLLFRAAPREVTLVYDLGKVEEDTRLEIGIRRGAELVRRAEFRLRPGDEQVRHTVQLQDGHYRMVYRISRDGAGPGGAGPALGERDVEVSESGTIVVPLGR